MERGTVSLPSLLNRLMITERDIEKFLEEINDVDFFVVDVSISPSMKVKVFVDNYKGISIGECEQIHRQLYSFIDGKIENFELEVSSPGLTKPLKVWQQYDKLKGKEISIITKDDENYEGKIEKADNAQVQIKTAKETITFDYTQIKKAKIILKF